MKSRSRISPAWSRSCASAISWGGRRERMGGGQGGAPAQGDVVENRRPARAAKLWEHVRPRKVLKDEVTSRCRRCHRRVGRARRAQAKATYDFAIHTHGSIGPSCAVAELKDGKLTAGRRRRPRTICASSSRQCSRCPRGRALHSRWRAPVATAATATRTPPPTRRCSPKRWACRCGCNGCGPTSTAGIRRGHPTLIDLSAAMDEAGGVKAWQSEFFIRSKRPAVQRAAHCCDDSQECRDRSHPRPVTSFRTRRYPTVCQCEHRLRTGWRGRRSGRPGIHAGAHAEHLRQRGLHRRARRGGNADPFGVPLKIRIAQRGIRFSIASRRSQNRAEVIAQARTMAAMRRRSAASPTASTRSRAPTLPRSQKWK